MVPSVSMVFIRSPGSSSASSVLGSGPRSALWREDGDEAEVEAEA